MEKVWRLVPGLLGYRVSSSGDVESRWKPYTRRPKGRVGVVAELLGDEWFPVPVHVMVTGYPAINIPAVASETGKPAVKCVHVLVCLAFHGPPPPGKTDAAHFPDPDKTNNSPDNLMWVTPAENMAHKLIHGTHLYGELHGGSFLTESDTAEILRECGRGASQSQMARKFKVHPSIVSRIVSGKRWKHLGGVSRG